MASFTKKLQALELRLQTYDPETALARTLIDAVASKDQVLTVEVLKSLGDLYLENGRSTKVMEEFEKTTRVYNAALLRCSEQDVAETIMHRIRYTKKVSARVLSSNIHSTKQEPETSKRPLETNFCTSNVSKAAHICLQLAEFHKSGNPVENSYTQTLIKALADGDKLLEAAIMQDIADLYLEEGTCRSEISMLNRASAMYEAAMKICNDGSDREETLQHRVKYSDKVGEAVIKRNSSRALLSDDNEKHVYQEVPINFDISRYIVDPDTLRSYRNHLWKGQRALEQGELETAEEEFASALKEADCDAESRQFRLKVEVECLQKLGHVYLERGKVTKAGGDFTKAAALFNAVMARTEDKYQTEKVKTVLKETERQFLYHTAGVDTVPSTYDIDLPHKSAVNEMRETIFQQFQTMDRQDSPYDYDSDTSLHTKAWEAEEERANIIQNLCKKITDDRKALLATLLAECMETIGPPPCQHAFIGLGSQATELATPYSDLEFAILIEEGKDSNQNKQYFRTLTHYLHLKVINLGETVVPAMAITSLNDFCSEDPNYNRDWFYDRDTPRGFAFDGSMPWASKTPLGRGQTKSKPPLELIQTPSGMASLQTTDLSPSEDYNLSWVLQHVCYMAGDQALVDKYIGMITRQQCHSKTNDAMLEARNIKNPKSPELTAQLLNVKREVYRLPTISIQNIASFFGVKSGSIWNMIDELGHKGHISIENAHHLKVLVAISAELRLRAYLSADSQRESVSTLVRLSPESSSAVARNTAIESVLYLPNRAILYRYYYTAYPLRKFVFKADQRLSSLQGHNTLFDASSYARGKMHMELCDFKAAQKDFSKALYDVYDPEKRTSVFVGLAEVSMWIGDPNRAIAVYQQGLDVAKRMHSKDLADQNIAVFLTGMGNAYLDVGKPEEAIKCYEEAMGIVNDRDVGDEYGAAFHHNLGVAWDNLGDHKKALGFFERAHELNVSLYGDAADPDIATTLDNLGTCWSLLGNDQKAIDYLEKALDMYKRAYGYDAAHPHIAITLVNLATSYMQLEDYKKAIDFYEHSLKMASRIYGIDKPHPVTAGILGGLGSCQTECETGQYKKAFILYEKALRMYKILYGNDGAHPNLAGTLLNIGRTWYEVGDHTRAIVFIKSALKMYTTLYGRDAKHQNIADSLSSLGECWRSLGDHKAATTILQSSLRMMISLHGADAAHPDIAKTLEKLGGAFGSMGDHATSVAYRTKAVDMYRVIYGQNATQRKIYSSLYNLGKALCDLGGYHRAIEVCEEALKMSRKVHGQESTHPHIAKVLNTLGVAWNFCNDYEKAIGFFEQSLKMNMEIHGEDAAHEDIVLALNNLGNAYDSLGENHKAIAFYQQSLDTSKRIHGCDADHEDIARSLCNLGSSYSDLYDTKALGFYEQALEMRHRIHGQESVHPDIAVSLYNLGLTWSDFGDDKKAIYYLERALALYRQRYKNDLPCLDIVDLLNSLGQSWSSLGNKSKAIDFFQESLVLSKHMYGEGTAHKDIYVALDNLGNIWKDLGDHRKAVDFFIQSLNVKKRLYGEDAAHPHIAASLNELGIACSTLNDYDNAIKYFKAALRMNKLVYGEDTAHPHIILCLQNLGKAWKCLGNEKNAKKYYSRAVTMSRRLKDQTGVPWTKH